MWCRTKRLGDRVIARVTPFGSEFNHQHKEKRVVEINLLNKTAQCVSLDTGEECGANSWGKLCAHVFRVLVQIEKNSKRGTA